MGSAIANRRTLRERVLSRLIIDPSGCLLWTGAINSHGYGHVNVAGRMRTVHRLMFEWFAGPVPDGHVPDHLCRIRHCAAPAHLEAVTPRENWRRGQSIQAINAAKDECDSGHPFDLFNTYRTPDGKRGCRACNRAAVSRYKARKKATS